MPAGAGVSRGHSDRDILVQGKHVVERRAFQRVHDREFGRPGIAEDAGHPIGFERVDEQVPTGVRVGVGVGVGIGGHTGSRSAARINGWALGK